MADAVVVMYLGKVMEQGPVDEIFHAPKHPYTRSLLRSIPSILAQPRTKLATISGSNPRPSDRPPGGPFHPRCAAFMAGVCDVQEPALRRIGEGQQVSYFLCEKSLARSSFRDDTPNAAG
jgi:oligopeptide/dipeptide ABC transporter ATP-binding protein